MQNNKGWYFFDWLELIEFRKNNGKFYVNIFYDLNCHKIIALL